MHKWQLITINMFSSSTTRRMRINYFNWKFGLSEIRNWHFVFTPCSICFIDFSPFAPVFLLLSPSCSRGICNFALRERLVRSSSGKLFMACRVSRRTARVFAFTGRRVSPVRNNLGSRGSCRFVRPAVKSFAWVSSSRRSHFRSRSPVAQEIRLADFFPSRPRLPEGTRWLTFQTRDF